MNLVRHTLKHTADIKIRFDELTELIAAPEIVADNKYWRHLVNERSGIEELAEKHVELKKAVFDAERCEKLLEETTDAELKKLLAEELADIESRCEGLCRDINILLSPARPSDIKNACLELRAVEPTEDSENFAYRLFEMYKLYAEEQGLFVEIDDIFRTAQTGLKYVFFNVNGKGAYGKLRYESGLHKAVGMESKLITKKSGTATAAVYVFPEEAITDIDISEKDIRIDLFHSGGAGGQNVNKVQTAVRITHIPTGIVVTCQDERSQLKNKQRAMKTLNSKLMDMNKRQREQEHASSKKEQFDKAVADKKVRTYNFQSRQVTDHRAKLQVGLEKTLQGNIDVFTDAIALLEEKR